jgi:hypothetical protein
VFLQPAGERPSVEEAGRHFAAAAFVAAFVFGFDSAGAAGVAGADSVLFAGSLPFDDPPASSLLLEAPSPDESVFFSP